MYLAATLGQPQYTTVGMLPIARIEASFTEPYCQFVRYVNAPGGGEWEGDTDRFVFTDRPGCRCGEQRGENEICTPINEEAWQQNDKKWYYSEGGDASAQCQSPSMVNTMCGGNSGFGASGGSASVQGAATAGSSDVGTAFATSETIDSGKVGQPITCTDGTKTQTEVLYRGHGPHPLTIKWHYRSHDFNGNTKANQL